MVDGVSSSLPVVVTPSVLTTSVIGNLQADQASMATLENEVSTGIAVAVPSDDPAEVANILQLQSGVTRANQYVTNAEDGLSWLSLANSTVSSMMTVLDQVQSAVLGITGDQLSGTASAVAGLSTVVTGAIKQLIDLANTQYAGQAIFSGTGTPTRAYDTTGTYVGAGAAPTRTVAPGSQVAVSVTGPQLFGTPSTPTTTTKSLIGVLKQIRTAIASGTASQLQAAATTGLTKLQQAMAVVETQAGKLGADQEAMQGFSAQATATATSLSQELGDAQDVTMAQALTNLQLQETSYEAAMYVASQLSTDSLVNYL